MTRLRYGVRGQDREVPTLIGSPRPTSACFLSADLLNPRLQTRFGRCTKRVGESALPNNLAEGSAKGTSALCRHPGGRTPILSGLKTGVSWRFFYDNTNISTSG